MKPNNPNREMTLNEYQERAMTTCMESSANPLYMMFGQVGEVGELMGKYAKLIRKDLIYFDNNQIAFTEKMLAMPKEERDQIEHDLKSEIGDCLWMLSGICHILGYELQEIADANLAKLASRKQRGVIDGNGDNR